MTPISDPIHPELSRASPPQSVTAAGSHSLVPRIYWPAVDKDPASNAAGWISVDLHGFPTRAQITGRSGEAEATFHLPAFKRNVQGALQRVLVADRYLMCGGGTAEREVLSWFPESFEANEVRIAFGGYAADDRRKGFKAKLAHVQSIINARRSAAGQGKVELRVRDGADFRSFPFLHDRFAIVDDELWHFGSTVGGTHPGVTAATRGWSATATGAIPFFNELWHQPQNSRTFRSACQGSRW